MSRRLIFAVLALLCAGAVSAQERTEAPAASSEVRYVGRTQTNGGDVSFCEIEAQWGHDAFLVPNKRLDGLISGFLDRVSHDCRR